jgi:hypothetical protein
MRSVLAVLDECGGEVVFGDRDERVGDGESRLVGAFAAVAGAPSFDRPILRLRGSPSSLLARTEDRFAQAQCPRVARDLG